MQLQVTRQAGDGEISLYQERDREKDRSLKMLNVYAGYGLDDAASTAMADVGVNVVRVDTEQADVGVGVRLDTGVALSEKAAKLYVAGFGGEVGYDDRGQVSSFGFSLGVLKFKRKLLKGARSDLGSSSSSSAAAAAAAAPSSMPSEPVTAATTWAWRASRRGITSAHSAPKTLMIRDVLAAVLQSELQCQHRLMYLCAE